MSIYNQPYQPVSNGHAKRIQNGGGDNESLRLLSLSASDSSENFSELKQRTSNNNSSNLVPDLKLTMPNANRVLSTTAGKIRKKIRLKR